MAILLSLGCVRTFTYANEWRNRDSLYAYSLANQPRSARIMLLVAEIDRQEGHLDQARAILKIGQQILPDYWEFWMHNGKVEEDAKNWFAAAAYYQRAFDMHPSNALANRITYVQRMGMSSTRR